MLVVWEYRLWHVREGVPRCQSTWNRPSLSDPEPQDVTWREVSRRGEFLFTNAGNYERRREISKVMTALTAVNEVWGNELYPALTQISRVFSRPCIESARRHFYKKSGNLRLVKVGRSVNHKWQQMALLVIHYYNIALNPLLSDVQMMINTCKECDDDLEMTRACQRQYYINWHRTVKLVPIVSGM